MKARHIILYAICAVAMALGALFFFVLKKHNAEMGNIRNLPEMTLVTIDGHEFQLSETRSGRKTAIMFFSPDCEFCRQELKGIIDNRISFQSIDWVFVTLSPQEEFEEFLHEYPLQTVPDARICVEERPDLFLALDVTAPPAIFIYNSRIQSMIYMTNWIERLQKDFRRVTRMRGAMPNDESVLTLMGKTAMDKDSYGRQLTRIDCDKMLFPD